MEKNKNTTFVKTIIMKAIFKTDILMAISYVATLYTGLEVHYAGHFQAHDVWHNWSLVHVLSCLSFTIVTAIHIRQHWAWYKNLFKNATRKQKITLILTLLFGAVTLSGIGLIIFVDGQGSSFGLTHYKIGLIFSVFVIGHFIKRWSILKKGISK